MEIQQTLYKLDSKTKLRVYNISTLNGVITQESGLLDGNLVTHTSTSKPKNIGKSNETTIQEQAVLEAKSKILKKLDEGYSVTIEEAQTTVTMLPMLAKSFGPEQFKIDWDDAFVQPKLDGMRALKNGELLISRKGKAVETVPHINTTLNFIPQILDGELYAHGLTFQENIRLLKKVRKESVNIKYHVYDVITDLPFRERTKLLESLVLPQDNILLVPTYKVNSLQDVQQYHAEFLSQGYEGTMVRWGNESYQMDTRSSNLLKYKDFQDIAAIVVDIVPSDKNPKQGVIHCEYKGKRFGCGMKFSHEERERMLTNKDQYIGLTAEIRFFEWTEGDIPRFPVCVGFRIDK